MYAVELCVYLCFNFIIKRDFQQIGSFSAYLRCFLLIVFWIICIHWRKIILITENVNPVFMELNLHLKKLYIAGPKGPK